MRTSSLAAALALACAHAPPAAPPAAAPAQEAAARPASPPVPVDLVRLQRHLERAEERAAQAPPGKWSPRSVVFDAAGGLDQQEHARLANGLLVLVLAVSRDAGELPLRRVRAQGPDGAGAELALVGTLPPAALARLRFPGVLGSAGWGGLYFLREARRTPGPLLADFARNREGMAFGALAPSVFTGLRDVAAARPEPQAVRELAARAFPAAELLPGLEARLR